MRQPVTALVWLSNLCLASTAWANDCPSIYDISLAAEEWQINYDDDFGEHYAFREDQTGARQTLVVPLWMDGGGDVTILDWLVPEQYKGKIGLMHYFSGAAGTHAIATFTRIAIVHMEREAVLQDLPFSIYVAGSRYTEDAKGNITEDSYADCQIATLNWYTGHVDYSFDGEDVTISFSAPPQEGGGY